LDEAPGNVAAALHASLPVPGFCAPISCQEEKNPALQTDHLDYCQKLGICWELWTCVITCPVISNLPAINAAGSLLTQVRWKLACTTVWHLTRS